MLALFFLSAAGAPSDGAPTDASKVVAATLAFGRGARVHAVLALESYVVNAQRDIPLYVVTDDAAEITRAIEEFATNELMIHIVEVVPPPGSVSAAMRIKSLKTMLFDLVPAAYDTMIYFDADVVLGLPLQFCYTKLARYYNQTAQASLALFAETMGAKGETHHTGVMLLRRAQVTPLMPLWRTEILNAGQIRDQTALMRVVAREKFTIQTLPFASGNQLLDFVGATLLSTLRTSCFVHYTNYRMVNHKAFGFTHEQARFYYKHVLRIRYLGDIVEDVHRPTKT